MPHRTGDASPLGELESAVMEVVWRHPQPVCVSEVHTALPKETPVVYTTVKTTMERLADKGILHRTKAGKAYLYQAALTREDLERRIVSKVLERLIEQFPQAVASFFVRPDSQLSEAQLALLSEAIEHRQQDEGV